MDIHTASDAPRRSLAASIPSQPLLTPESNEPMHPSTTSNTPSFFDARRRSTITPTRPAYPRNDSASEPQPYPDRHDHPSHQKPRMYRQNSSEQNSISPRSLLSLSIPPVRGYSALTGSFASLGAKSPSLYHPLSSSPSPLSLQQTPLTPPPAAVPFSSYSRTSSVSTAAAHSRSASLSSMPIGSLSATKPGVEGVDEAMELQRRMFRD